MFKEQTIQTALKAKLDDEVLAEMRRKEEEKEQLIQELKEAIGPRWIPVEERLPEPLKDVIVYHDTGKIDIGYWDYDGDYVYQSLGKALAWMPLPEPYKL